MTIIDRIRTWFDAMDRPTRLRWGYGIIAVLVLAIALSAVYERIGHLEQQRRQREADLVTMLGLKGEVLAARLASQRLANRLAAVQGGDSPAKIIEEIGIRGKSLRLTPVKGEERPGFVEEAAEVKLEGLSASEAVTLLHRLEKGPRPVAIRKALIRTRFDDPAHLDLTMTVALLKAPVPGSR